MPSGKREAAGFHFLSALSAAQPEEIRQRRQATEQTKFGILRELGKEGTYGPDAGPSEDFDWKSGFTTKQLESTTPDATGVDRRYTGHVDGQIKMGVRQVDSDKYIKGLKGSSLFRTMSRQVAESEQMVNKEGKLYEEMQRNIQNPIVEGHAALARENASEMRRMMRRGGGARRNAMAFHQEAVQRSRDNMIKTNQLWKANQALQEFTFKHAKNTRQDALEFVNALPGLTENLNNAMDNASALMVNSAIPRMITAKQEAAKWRYRAHAKNREKLGRIIQGVIGVGSMLVGGMGAAGISGFQMGGMQVGFNKSLFKKVIQPNAGDIFGFGMKAGISALPGSQGGGGYDEMLGLIGRG